MSSTEREILRSVEKCLSVAGLGPSTPVVAACSGGSDSTALVLLLEQLRPNYGYPLVVAYYNHNLRGRAEADREVGTVRDLCRRRQLMLICGEAAAGQIRSAAKGRSLEEVAREFRRNFLAKTADEINSRHVALGHTADDQIETLVMRFLQGSGWRGLRAMEAMTGLFLRPMLKLDRAKIVKYLGDKSQDFYTDPTNSDLCFLRNKVRRTLLPVIEQIFPGYRHSLQLLADKMRDLGSLVEEHDQEYLWQAVDGVFQIPTDRFLALSRVLRHEGIMQAWDNMMVPENTTRRRLPYRFVERFLDGDLSEASGHGVRIHSNKGHLTLERVIVSNVKKGYVVFLGQPRDCTVETNALRIVMEHVPKGPGNEAIGMSGSWADPPGVPQRKDAGALLFAEGAVYPPLVVRSRRTGDRLLTDSGTRSVKRILIDLTGSAGEDIPVLVDKRGVVAVLGALFGVVNVRRKGFSGLYGDIMFLLKISQRS